MKCFSCLIVTLCLQPTLQGLLNSHRLPLNTFFARGFNYWSTMCVSLFSIHSLDVKCVCLPFAIIIECKITQNQIPKTISWWKEHFLLIFFIEITLCYCYLIHCILVQFHQKSKHLSSGPLKYKYNFNHLIFNSTVRMFIFKRTDYISSLISHIPKIQNWLPRQAAKH